MRAFHEDGVVLLKDVFEAEEIARLRAALDMQLANANKSPTAYDFEQIAAEIWEGKKAADSVAHRFDVAALSAVVKGDKNARPLREALSDRGRGTFLFEASGWRRHRAIRDFALDSCLPKLAAELLDSPVVSFWDDTTFIKGPFTKQKTAFHQDLGYNNYDGRNAIVFWTPLDSATEASGVMKYIRRSHKDGSVYAPNLFLSQTTMPGATAPKCPDIEADEDSFDIICYDVEPGDVIAHHIRTIHGAGGNLTGHMRRAISFHYCGEDARYFSRAGAAPRLHDVDTLADGDAICSRDHPVVWPRPWPQLKLADLLPLRTNVEPSAEAMNSNTTSHAA